MEPPLTPAAATPERPWQFRLRTLLMAVALMSIVLAVLTRVTAAWAWGLLLGVLMIAAHVFANAWGTRQRNEQTGHDPERPVGLSQQSVTYAPNTQLSASSRRVSWVMILGTSLTALVCGSLGAWALASAYAATDGYAGVVVGTISAGVLGGFLGFLCSTFYDHSRRALREATQFAPQIKQRRNP